MTRKRAWMIVAMSTMGVLMGALVGVAGYLRYANQVPDIAPLPAALPNPNGYDALAAAAMSLPKPQKPIDDLDTIPMAELRVRVAANRRMVTDSRKALKLECQAPPILSYRQLLPELDRFRDLARAYVTEGKLAEREGRLKEAADCYLDALRLGERISHGGALIHGLVSVFVTSMGNQRLFNLADRLDADTAAACARELQRIEARSGTVADAMANERDGGLRSMAEMLRQMHTWRDFVGTIGGGTSNGPFGDAVTGVKFAFTPRRQVLEHYRDYMDQIVARSKQPYYKMPPPPRIPDDPVNQALAPFFSAAVVSWARRDTHLRLTEIRLAARAHTLRTGAVPEKLTALVPAYLNSVPEDPFAPQTLVYHRTGDGFTAYSLGPDRTDSGGRLDLGEKVNDASKGDIVTPGKGPR